MDVCIISAEKTSHRCVEDERRVNCERKGSDAIDKFGELIYNHLLPRTQEKIANQRLDMQHKLSLQLKA